MSTQIGSIHYDVGLNTSQFDAKAAALSGKLKDIGSKMTDIGKKMTMFVTVPVVAGMGFAVKAASDLEETINKVDVSFGKSAPGVKKWSETAIESMGMAQQSALDMAALFGDMGTGMGMGQKDAAGLATSLTQLAGDLASFKNLQIAEVQTALSGVFTGETESLKRLGIVMTETNLAMFAKSKGVKKDIADMTQAEKINLRYAYIMDVTKNAQGDFARTSKSTANQIRTAKENVKELSAELGKKLLPMVNNVLEKFIKLVDNFKKLPEGTKKTILILAGIAAVLGPLLIIFGGIVSAISTLLPLLASPVFWIVVGVLAAIAGVAYLVWQNWDKIRPVVKRVTSEIKQFWELIKPLREFVVGQLKQAWDSIIDAGKKIYEAIKPLLPLFKEVAKYLAIALVGAIALFLATIVGAILLIARFVTRVANMVSFLAEAYGKIVSFFKSLPEKIKKFFSNPGEILVNAGRAIINGLFNGITERWNKLKGKISSIAGWIKDHKGPIQKDRVLLVDEGKAIMDGFNKGILNGYSDVKKTISGINGNIKGGFGQNDSTSTTIYGNINIGSNVDAENFLTKLTRNQELARRSMATAPGSLG